MGWIWRLESVDGTAIDGADTPVSPSHPNQSDAETWLGETWRELSEAGVAQVSLFEDDRLIYGPMPLAEA
jgi:hypothetical protein